MTIKAVEEWKEARQKENALRECFIDFNDNFRGKLFQICTQRYISDYEKILKKFDPKTGLGEIIYDKVNWFSSIKHKVIDPEEYMMTTGKIIAKRLVPTETCTRHVIIGLELITTKGVGFLRREILRGPLENKNGKVKLIWDPSFQEDPNQNTEK